MLFERFTYSLPLYPNMEGWSTSHHQKILKTRTKVVLPEKGFLGLYFNLGLPHKHNIPGFKEGIIQKNQYNLLSLPEKSIALTLPKGEHNSFCIHLTPEFLKGFASTFPRLWGMLDAHDETIPLPISNISFTASLEMMERIQEVIDNKFNLTGIVKDMFDYARIMGLFFTCLAHIDEQINTELEVREISKIRRVHNFIHQNLKHQLFTGFLADFVQMDPVRLEQTFKVYFRKNIGRVISEARVRKAKELLVETSFPISKIASMVGYTPTKMTDEFKRNCGYPPRYVRMKDV